MTTPRSAVWAISLAAVSVAAITPFGMGRFVFAKLLVLSLAIAAGACASRRGVLPRSIQVLLVLGALVLVVSALLGDAPLAQLVGRWPRYEGFIVLALYVGCAWLGARLLHGDADAQHTLFTALSVVAIAIAVYSGLEALGVQPMGAAEQERTGGLLGNATDLGIAGSLCLVLLVRPALAHSWLCAVGALASLVIVALSGSRAALLGTLVALVILALLSDRRRLRIATLSVAFGAITLAVALPQMRDRLTSGHTVNGRAVLWRESLDMVGDHWLTGVGPSGYFDVIARYHGTTWVREVGVSDPPDSPHAWWLQAMSAGGVPLGLLAIALAAAVLVLGLRAVRAASSDDLFTAGALAMTIAYGIEVSTHFTTAGTTPLAAFVVGGLVARGAPPREVAARRYAVATLALVAAAWSATAIVAEVQLERGINAVREGDTPGAVDAFEAAIHWRPWDSDTKMLAAASLAEAASDRDIRAFGPTLRWARDSLAAVPDNRTSHLALGVAATAAGDLTTAIRELDETIRIAPTEPQAYVQRGIARYMDRDVVGAFKDLQKALTLDPDNEQAVNVLAQIRTQLGGPLS